MSKHVVAFTVECEGFDVTREKFDEALGGILNGSALIFEAGNPMFIKVSNIESEVIG